MSIFVISEPSPLEHIFNPFYYQATSTNYLKLNFKMLFDVYCSNAANNASTATTIYVGRYKMSPDFTTGYATFSPARVLENYIYNHYNPFISATTLTNYSQIAISVKYGEEYDASPTITGATGTTIYSGLSTSTTIHAINSVRQYDELHSDLANYDIGTSVNFLLTNWVTPDVKKIKTNEYEVLSVYTSTGNLKNVLLNTFDKNNNLIGYYYLSGSTSGATLNRFDIPAGTANLSYTYYNSIISGTDFIMNSGVSSYNLHIVSDSGQVSYDYYYDIDNTCTRYNPKRLCWLNRWGGYDYFTFDLIDVQSIDRKTTEWRRLLNKPDWNIGDLSRIVLNVDAKTRFAVTSDWVDDNESAFLQNLFTSPEIYLLDGINKLPIIITDTTVNKGTKLNNVITNYTFNFDYGWTLNLQRT